MNRKITSLICLMVLLLSGCSQDETQTRGFVVAEFADPIVETDIFQAESRAYVATVRGASEEEQIISIYRVDLLSGEKTFLFSTDGDGYSSDFIVSADEKFIAIGAFQPDPSDESPARLELFDMSTNTKTVLTTVVGFFRPFGFDPENKILLYGRYGDSDQNKVRTIDLASGEEEIMITENGSLSVLDINPVTSDILMWASGKYCITDWNGTVIGEPITGFEPQFFSPDGKEIIGSRGFVWDANMNFMEVVRYTIATGEVESLTGTETKGEFYAASMSPDQSFVLGLTNDTRDKFLDDLYVVNTVTLERSKLMSTRSKEQAIGFFDAGRKVLFEVPYPNGNILYGVKLD